MPAVDIEGQEFGELVAVSPAGRVKGHNTWLCFCKACNRHVKMRVSNLRRSGTKTCGCSRRYDDPSQPCINKLIGRYKRRAKQRGLIWALTDDDCKRLFTSNCFYDNAPPSNAQKTRGGWAFNYSGIDRKINAQGYYPDNVVPCCWACNDAKGTKDADEFIAWIKGVHKHLCQR